MAELAVSRPAPLVRLLNAQRGWIAVREVEEIIRLVDRREPRRADRVRRGDDKGGTSASICGAWKHLPSWL